MNSLLFNKTASELRTSIYGFNAVNSDLEVVQLNSLGELLIATSAPLTVTGLVTIANAITIANASLTVLVAGNSFTADEDPQVGVSGKGYVFDKKDISNVRTATMFIDNIGTAPITIKPKWDIVCE